MSRLKRRNGPDPKRDERPSALEPISPIRPSFGDNAHNVAQISAAQEHAPALPHLDQLSTLDAPQAASPEVSAADLAAELETLAADLFYVSESDDTFSAASLDAGAEAATGAATEGEVRAALGLEPEAAVQILDANEAFWAYYTDAEIHGEAEAARFQALHDRMVDSLTEIRLVKTDGAEDWEKIIHLIGRHESGALVGLRSTGVET